LEAGNVRGVLRTPKTRGTPIRGGGIGQKKDGGGRWGGVLGRGGARKGSVLRGITSKKQKIFLEKDLGEAGRI